MKKHKHYKELSLTKAPAFLSSRIIKLLANLLKASCYIFHYFFPNKRFRLPHQSAPLIKLKNNHIIPKILWQTNFTDRVTLPVYLNYLFNRLLAYDYEYRFMVTEKRNEFIQKHYHGLISDSYSRLQIGASQADLWRILILYKYGGVYMDIDAHLVWPLRSIIRKNHTDLYIIIKKGEISNYFIASKSENKKLKAMLTLILKNISENTIKNVYELTGPAIFNEILDVEKENTVYYRYTCNQGNFTNDHFQYIDKAEGKWTREQKKTDLIK